MNLFKLVATIGLDTKEYEDKVKKTTDDARGFSSKLGGYFVTGVKTVAKATMTMVTVAASAVGAIAKSAIENYAEYEQLVGGAQKIFNDMDYSKIQKDAQNAYKTMNISANEYLSIINDVGATFAATMGDEAGYEAAKTGLKAISDYASGTGKNVNELSEKFTLITRSTSSYQSIADQFSGILPATSAGFLEQAQAAGILSDSYTELSQVPLDEYQAAISQMLEKGVTDLGLYDNAVNESFSTLSGSLAMTKSAWSNLVTGLADDSADLDMLIGNFVESVGAVATNLIPKIGTALNGASKLVRDLIPAIVKEIPIIIKQNLPVLAEAAVSIVKSLANGISDNQEILLTTALETVVFLAAAILNLLPQIVALGLDLIVSLANGIAESLPELIPTIVDVVLQIVDTLTNPDTLSNLIDAAIAIIIALADGLIESLPGLIEKAPEIVQNLVDTIVDNAPKLLEAALTLVLKLAEGILSNLPELVTSGIEIVSSIIEGIVELLGDLVMKGKDIVDSVKEGFSEKVESAKTWGKDLIDNFIAGITEKWDALKKKVSDVAQTVKDYLGFSEPKKGPLSNFHTYVPDMMDLFAKGIRDNEDVITDQIEKSFDFGERTIKFGVEYGGGYGSGEAGMTYGSKYGVVNIVQNIYSEAKTAADLMQEAVYQQEMAVYMGV